MACLIRIEGNHIRADLGGELDIGDNSYAIDAQTKVKSGKITTTDIHGKSGNERLILRGYLIPSETHSALWTFVAHQAGKFGGKTRLHAMIGDVELTATLPPSGGDKNELHHSAISTIGNQVAGNEFSFTVTAVNGFGNIKTDYTGTVTVSTNDGNSPAPSNKAPEFKPVTHSFVSSDNGQFTLVATLFNAKNDVTMTAADSVDTAKKGTSSSFIVSPAAIHSVDVTASAASVTVGGTVDLEANAYDVYSNEVSTTFAWTVDPTAGGSVSPTSSAEDTTFTAAAVSEQTIVTVKATASGKSDSATLTVNPV